MQHAQLLFFKSAVLEHKGQTVTKNNEPNELLKPALLTVTSE